MRRIRTLIYARLLLLAATFGFGIAMTSSATTKDEGEALFAAQCADCHGPRDIAWWADQYPDEDERREWLARLLERHYPPADEERALIVEHIQSVIAGE